jgi:surfactin synthase thioesterase subunit
MRSAFETPWILRDPAVEPRARDDPSVRLRLFCLPQAGCGAWSYHGWQKRLPPHVEVLPVEYPGRNSRLRHPFEYESLQDLASAVVDAIEPLLPTKNADADASRDAVSSPPFCLLGWSMGAWLGYEMVLEIERRGRSALPLRVFLGGARSPSFAGPEFDPDRDTPALSALPKNLFWDAFARRYGANRDLEKSEALRDLLLPTLRLDFRLMERYRPSAVETPNGVRDVSHREVADANALGDATGFSKTETSEEPSKKKKRNAPPRVAAARLPVPLVAFGARGDARYEQEQLSAWRDVAPLDRVFLERWFEGPRATPHRLVLDRPEHLFRFLNEAFAAINVVASKAVA